MLVILYTLAAAALAVAHASSSVYVSYPLDDQLPPIARIDSPFNWTFSLDTFVSDSDDTLTYTMINGPAWLSLDPSSRSFSGTPTEDDEGSSQITVTASGSKSSDSASSSVVLCVTPYRAPELQIPVEDQFIVENPSLSSVFIVSNSSALHGGHPTLRVPPKWSFSIGFDYNTFVADNSLYYAARQANGSPLPHWIEFNERAMTFNGVTPENITVPEVFSFVLHASDQEGYSAASVEFDLVVAKHDFALGADSLPTINVTAGQHFQLTLTSAVDFAGVLIDGQAVLPANITSLDINTSGLESWLKYDANSSTLSGQPPDDFTKGDLPVTLTSSVNQTLQTDVTIAAVPSFFTGDTLTPIQINPGSSVAWGLTQFFSNNSGLGKASDVEFSASYNPLEAGSFLSFNPNSTKLTGTVPPNVSYQHIDITYTAYSHVTHSTSHTTLPISLSSADYQKQHNKANGGAGKGLSPAARAKMILGLKIAFGIICGFVNIAILFALFRKCTRVPDSAATGEEGRRAWTAEEKKWYGIGIEVNGEKYEPPVPASASRNHWSEGIVTPSRSRSTTKMQDNEGLGVALSRVLTRTLSNLSRARSPLSPVGHPQSPPMIRKVEFMGRIRATARIVSDKYKRVVSGPKRPVISKPTLIVPGEASGAAMRTDIDGLPFSHIDGLLSVRDLRPLDDSALSQYAPSGLTSLIDSPSSSTGGRSIPRRRADFAPPKSRNVVGIAITTPPAAHLGPGGLSAQDIDHRSFDSLSSGSSSRTHEAEAVVQHATRATSVRSAVSGSSDQTNTTHGEGTRPRLVPFTNATRVPVPKLPSTFFPEGRGAEGQAQPQEEGQGAKTKRVVSQMAKVFRNVGATVAEKRASKVSAKNTEHVDELRTGIEYVRALGGDGQNSLAVSQADRSPADSAMSLSTLETNQHGHDDVNASSKAANRKSVATPVPRTLARTGERFKFRVPVSATAAQDKRRSMKGDHDRALETRLVNGRPLPKFMRVDLGMGPNEAESRGEKRFVELWGVPVRNDIGEYEVGVYEKVARGEGEEPRCVGRVVVEVVERRSGRGVVQGRR